MSASKTANIFLFGLTFYQLMIPFVCVSALFFKMLANLNSDHVTIYKVLIKL